MPKRKPSTCRRWTEQEDNFLRENRGKMTCAELAAGLKDRTEKAVRGHLCVLGISIREEARPWTKQEDEFIKKNRDTMTCAEIAKKLGRTTRAAETRIIRLGLKKHTLTDDLKPKQKIGYLTLLEKTRKDGLPAWRCLCVCGKETTVPATNLAKNNTTSCGCYQAAMNADIYRNMAAGKIDGVNVSRLKSPKPNSNSTTGHKNISHETATGRYRVTVGYKSKQYRLGRYGTIEDAIRVRDAFMNQLMPELDALDAKRQAMIPELIKDFKTKFAASVEK